MPQTGWTSADTVVPVSHTHMETSANNNNYGVIAGCGVTLDGTDLTFDIAAGAIMHNGKPVAVAAQANAGTLVADSANPRFTLIYLDSTGTAGLTSGTAASSPVPPDQGDYVPLMLVKIAAGGTVASSQTSYDQRVFHRTQTWRSTSNFTKNANVTLGDVTGIKFQMGASEVWAFEAHLGISTGATPDIKMAFTVPSGATATGKYSYLTGSGILNSYVSDWTAAQSMATAAAGVGAILSGIVVNSTTAGTVQLQAAQDTSDVSDTIIYAQSHITAWRLT